jgi:hypothetical protein
MIQVWYPEDPAMIVRLDSLFAHVDGLPMPYDWKYGRPHGLGK